MGKKKREINCGMYENLIKKRICKNRMEKKLKMGEKSGGKEKNEYGHNNDFLNLKIFKKN